MSSGEKIHFLSLGIVRRDGGCCVGIVGRATGTIMQCLHYPYQKKIDGKNCILIVGWFGYGTHDLSVFSKIFS